MKRAQHIAEHERSLQQTAPPTAGTNPEVKNSLKHSSLKIANY